MASREEDKAMAGLLRRTLASDAAAAAGKDCPAPEILAAYFDRSLDADETARYDLHFSQCSRCREQLVAMARASEVNEAKKEAASGWNWLRTPRWLRPTAAAFAVLVLIAGITLRRWKARDAANEIAMSRPDVELVPAPETSTAATPQPSESKAPAKPPSGAAEPKNQMFSGGVALDKNGEGQYFRVLPSPGQKKAAGATRGARGGNAPASSSVGSGSSTLDATRAETAPVTDAQSVVLAPNKLEPDSAARDSSAPTPEAAAKQPGTVKGKTAARAAASAPAPSSPRFVAGSSFSARDARDAAERARIQQAQLSSNLMAGFVVPTPDAKVLWMISDSGSIGHSEDAGATWKYESLESHDHFVAGSAPAAKICWLLGEHGSILRTTDGTTWTTVEPPAAANIEGFVGIEAKDESSATVTSTDGRKFSTSDGGKTWTLAK